MTTTAETIQQISTHLQALSDAFLKLATDLTDQPKTTQSKSSKSTAKQTKAEPKITIDDVRQALIALAQAQDKEAAKAILTQFNVEKVTALSADDYAKVIQAAKDACNE